MKKQLLVLVGIIGLVSLFAQNRLNIHLNHNKVEHVAISSIDSINFGANDTMLCVRLLNQSVAEFPLSTIDSLTFSDTVSFLPIVHTIGVDNILQTSSRSGIELISLGASSVTTRGICWSTTPNPTIADTKNQSASTSSPLYLYLSSLTGNTTYHVRAYATNSFGTGYGEDLTFTSAAYLLPQVTTSSVTNAGGLEATCSAMVTNTGGYFKCSAQGFCWATTNNPTLENNVVASTSSLINVLFSKSIVFPTANVTYYVRAFATNPTGTSYGAVLMAKPTIGNLTYYIDTNTLPVGSSNYNLIKIAMDSAMYYYNRYATFTGNIKVTYNSGVPTAQSNYRGTIDFGSNTTYMHVSTAMHETAHWLGSGTSTSWKNFCVNGLWTGPTAVALLKSLTGETLYCDNNANLWHFWPYGLNQRSEATSANVYIIHAKLVNAMKTDCAW
jgi:hypothetical protein